MELQVLVSKKGTKVVTATNLYNSLQLPNQHYGTHVRKWISDVYEFKDGIRKPVGMQDYARRKRSSDEVTEDYYLSVELAKLISLNSRSKVKQKYANYLFSLEDKVEHAELLDQQQLTSILELVKAMSLVSCQEACERQHLRTYKARNNGSAAGWWKHRAEVLGYSLDDLRSKLRRRGLRPVGKNQRQLLQQLDRYEPIRNGVIDLFMALGKNQRYATNIGHIAKLLARELDIQVIDDRQGPSVFQPDINSELLAELKAFKQDGFLSRWQ